ncbi:type IV toxin-antitoxin system AbiEi family antitoxin domain-containing protein [Cupriavidus sp. YAF13]|uniref:type IV toxin-antitoxin system AbiEi family antitoxin domain-containing protein n=1 Tax=Cupriavidus sp. YAF13 TaxID=3233075 RepID=UPI003F8EDE24
MSTSSSSQRERAVAQLRARGLVRASEMREIGVTATTIARLERDGVAVRLARGVYQLADAPLGLQHTLALASKLVPSGVICLTSALAFHELTDQIPAKVWMAIGQKDWKPSFDYPPVRFIRSPAPRDDPDTERHAIDNVSVPVFSVARTIADLFRYRKKVGLNTALEGLREALMQKKATPAEIAQHAADAGVWKILEPYLTAMVSHA